MSSARGTDALGDEIDRMNEGFSLDPSAAISSVFGTNCFPLLVAIGAITPLVVWLILYFIQPRFIHTRKDVGYVQDNWKLLKWTAIISVLLWIVFYLFTFCKDYKQQNICLG